MHATDGRNVGGDPAPAQLAGMLNVGDVAKMLRCSSRTVYRLADSGRMPRPIKLGALVRWPREQVEAWIADGCPNCRSTSSRRAADGRKAVR
jgi:excisionase family DNA binding protein